MPLRLVAADDRLEQMAERDTRECELCRGAPLRRHDPQPPALVLELHEHLVDARAARELVVERLVVRAVHRDELVDVLRRQRAHLRLEPGPADGCH